MNELEPNGKARILQCGSKQLELGRRTLLMGILNVTPDSFSDGGRYHAVDDAIRQAWRLLEEGADILDIGGESTRPGHTPVSADEELERVLPILEALRREHYPIPISVDTYKGSVAEAAVQAGASIINDVWGGHADPSILQVAARENVPIVLMHNREDMNYPSADFVEDILGELRGTIRQAVEAGVKESHIVVDPGFGFAKNRAHNLHLMNRLSDLKELGYPILLGTSRKRFIRESLGLEASEAMEGTVATTVIGIMQGVSIVRVHDVLANKRAAAMADAIRQSADRRLS